MGAQRRDDRTAVPTGAAIDAAGNILQMPPDKAVEVSPRQVEAFEICPEAPVLVFLRFGERLDPLDIRFDIHRVPCYALAFPGRS
jgi:hypothetical protein